MTLDDADIAARRKSGSGHVCVCCFPSGAMVDLQACECDFRTANESMYVTCASFLNCKCVSCNHPFWNNFGRQYSVDPWSVILRWSREAHSEHRSSSSNDAFIYCYSLFPTNSYLFSYYLTLYTSTFDLSFYVFKLLFVWLYMTRTPTRAQPQVQF